MCATDSMGGGDAAGGNGSFPSGVIRVVWMARVDSMALCFKWNNVFRLDMMMISVYEIIIVSK